jgi:deoxyribonuclease V
VPKVKPLHSWDLDTTQARDLQKELAGRVDTTGPLLKWTTVAGADVSYDIKGRWLFAAVVVLDAATLELIEWAGAVDEAKFPYVPGLLSFRETPAVLRAYEELTVRPDVLICDGQGLAHPRRMGLACHVGLWLDLPTVGCAKSRLCGEYGEPSPESGKWSPLIDNGETIGAVVRTRSRIKPLFVSPGHHCDLESAISVVLASCRIYRLPIPSRLAHLYVNELRRHGRNQIGDRKGSG